LPADTYLKTPADLLVKDRTNLPQEIVIVKPKLPEISQIGGLKIDDELLHICYSYQLLLYS
jgi:hypothetical protein